MQTAVSSRTCGCAGPNGSLFRIRATTFQSALDLKSTKFYIGAEYPPPLTIYRYQEAEARLAYAGDWGLSTSARLLGRSQVWSESSGASATISFKGSGMRWIGNKAPTYGRANVYVDGSFDRTVDLYSAKPAYQQTLWSAAGLSVSTTHTVHIRVLRSRNASSRGYAVALDAVDVLDGRLVSAPQPVTTFQENDSRLAFAGDWLRATNTAMSGGAYSFASDAGARAVVRFFGRGVRWMSSTSPSNGTARVSVDGGAWVTVNLRSSPAKYRKIAWSKTGLALGEHTVIVEVARPKAPGLAGPVPFDAIQIVGGALHKAVMPWQRVEETVSSVTWAGAWSIGRSKALSAGSQRYSASKGARATFSFSGTSVRWVGSRGPTSGKASVSIDGQAALTIDLYAASPAYKQVLFGRSGLRNGPHTLTVRVLGSSRPDAKGKSVSVDAFDVAGVGAVP